MTNARKKEIYNNRNRETQPSRAKTILKMI